MPRLMFVMPAHGRFSLTRICLAQLRRTCDRLTENGIQASAVVIADDDNLDTAAEFGFATFGRRNTFLSQRFNDGLQVACDPALNRHPADYAVPIGSDDWCDWRLFLDLPPADTMVAFRKAAVVREDGLELVGREIDNPGGVGMRIYPRQMLERVGYRPADEERSRGCDTSILVNISAELGGRPRIRYGDRGYLQFVDWKSAGSQLNSYANVAGRFRHGIGPVAPFDALAGHYDADLLDEMEAYYERVRARPLVAEHEGGFPLYEVLKQRGYRGHPKGSKFTARLDRGAVQRAVERGDIHVLEPTTPNIQPGSYRLPHGWDNQHREVEPQWASASH